MKEREKERDLEVVGKFLDLPGDLLPSARQQFLNFLKEHRQRETKLSNTEAYEATINYPVYNEHVLY